MKITGINGSLPLHMAKAYGIKPTAQNPPINSVSQIATPQKVDSFQPTGSQPVSSAQQLVAGRVSQSVNFDATPSAASRSIAVNQVFQMYTRAADKVEAAVAVQIGKAIDIRA